jgi:hypothetical protein
MSIPLVQLQNIREFMKRVEVRGDESFAYVAACQHLESEMKVASETSDSPEEESDRT